MQAIHLRDEVSYYLNARQRDKLNKEYDDKLVCFNGIYALRSSGGFYPFNWRSHPDKIRSLLTVMLKVNKIYRIDRLERITGPPLPGGITLFTGYLPKKVSRLPPNYWYTYPTIDDLRKVLDQEN